MNFNLVRFIVNFPSNDKNFNGVIFQDAKSRLIKMWYNHLEKEI